LRLTSELTGKLRERARQEGTTLHGALSSALALSYWQTEHELKEELRLARFAFGNYRADFGVGVRGRLDSLVFDILWPADRYVEIRYQTVGQRIDPAVDTKVLTACPSLLHKDVRCDVADLADNVQFA
jgi:hypothetical protein